MPSLLITAAIEAKIYEGGKSTHKNSKGVQEMKANDEDDRITMVYNAIDDL
jgi:hypothetical protein